MWLKIKIERVSSNTNFSISGDYAVFANRDTCLEQSLTFNTPEFFMTIAVFELLAANPANAVCFCTKSPGKEALEKLTNGTVVNLGKSYS